MACDSAGQLLGEIGVVPMKAQERDNRSMEVFDVLGLHFLPASSVTDSALREALRGSLGLQFGANALHRFSRSPNAFGKDLSALLLGDGEVISGCLILRVRATSPGGTNIQPLGTLTTLPSAARTVFDVGPGEKVLDIVFCLLPFVSVRPRIALADVKYFGDFTSYLPWGDGRLYTDVPVMDSIQGGARLKPAFRIWCRVNCGSMNMRGPSANGWAIGVFC